MRLGSFLAAAGAAALVFSASAASAQDLIVTLDPTDPTTTAFFGNAISCNIGTGDVREYKTTTVTVTTSGLYTINDLVAPGVIADGALGLYLGTFDPNNTNTNCVATVGDGLTDIQLDAGTYVAVLTKYTPTATINQVGFKFSGADPVTFGPNPAVPAAIPTLTEWAMILLGVALAGGAALMIQRRRMA